MTKREFKLIREWLKKAKQLRANLVEVPESGDYELVLSCEVSGEEDELVIIGLPASDDLLLS